MSGKIRIGYSAGNMKCCLHLDKGWTDAHGRDKVTDIRQKLKKRLLAKKDSCVVGQDGNGAVAVDKKDDRGVKGAVAVDEEKPWKEFVKEKIIDPANELLVQVQM